MMQAYERLVTLKISVVPGGGHVKEWVVVWGLAITNPEITLGMEKHTF